MKILKTYTSMTLVLVALFWTACKKEISQPGAQQPQSNQPRYGGFVEDDPQVVSKVPFLISSNLLTQSSEVAASRGGGRTKPIKNGPDATPPTVSINSPTQGQTLDAASLS